MATDRLAKRAVSRVLVRTPMGWVYAAARDGRLIAVSLPRPRREALGWACPSMPADRGSANPLLAALAEDLKRYFSGQRVNLCRYPVDLSGQPTFRRRALLAARRIPYGETRSYQWLAARAGRPKAARAAGQAMAHNPIALVIPCHRVVASDGTLGGFGGGLEMKRGLLALEGRRVSGRRVRLTLKHPSELEDALH